MPGRLHQICRGEVLTPERCEAYRQAWAKQVQRQRPKVRHAAPELPTEIEIAAERAAAQRGMLAGDLLAALTTAIGIPPCGGCKQRKQWLNRAHAWLRGDPAPDR